MKKKFIRQEVFGLEAQMRELGDIKGVKLVYSLSRNHDLLKKYVKDFSLALSKIEMSKAENEEEYEKKRFELCEKHSKKNPDGTPVILGKFPNQSYDILDQKVFEEDMTKLNKKYQEVIDAKNKKEADKRAYLLEEVEMEFYRVEESFLPKADSNISKQQMDTIITFID